jgi:hypothetical protein
VEEAKRTALGKIPVPTSHALDTCLPQWLVEIVPAMSFSTGLLVLGFVLVGFVCLTTSEPCSWAALSIKQMSSHNESRKVSRSLCDKKTPRDLWCSRV